MSYARSYWPCYMDKWFEIASVEKDVHLDFCDNDGEITDHIDFYPIYTPEFSSERKQLEVRVMDGTHIRTNIKSKLIRQRLGNLQLTAWKRVANSGETNLVPAMLEVRHDGKIMHQQSDPYVRTMFCKDVEDIMIHNGDLEEAKFCRLFREWHEAEDKAGLSALERCRRSLQLREWLLQGYDFGRFPSPSQYVRGIPRTTFEGLVCSIDAHVLLYGMVKGGAYNWRTVSTLVAENFMGELAERSQNNHGVPSGNTLAADMAKISELHEIRLNPKRSFQMKTSKSRAYEVSKDISTCDIHTPGVEAPAITRLSKVTVRNHEFDERKGARKGKHGTLSKLNEQPKGVQPVRYHYKVDESRIYPSLRLGISENDLHDML